MKFEFRWTKETNFLRWWVSRATASIRCMMQFVSNWFQTVRALWKCEAPTIYFTWSYFGFRSERLSLRLSQRKRFTIISSFNFSFSSSSSLMSSSSELWDSTLCVKNSNVSSWKSKLHRLFTRKRESLSSSGSFFSSEPETKPFPWPSLWFSNAFDHRVSRWRTLVKFARPWAEPDWYQYLLWNLWKKRFVLTRKLHWPPAARRISSRRGGISWRAQETNHFLGFTTVFEEIKFFLDCFPGPKVFLLLLCRQMEFGGYLRQPTTWKKLSQGRIVLSRSQLSPSQF